jgi:hypothetical protein
MANQAELDAAPSLDDLIEDQTQEDEATEGSEAPEDEGEGEIVVLFGDEAEEDDELADLPPEKRERYADLRRQNRQQAMRIKELETQHTAPAVEIGDKPTLASCEYDPDRFEAELDAWKEKKAQFDQAQTEAQREQEAAQAEWQAELDRYAAQGRELKVPDYKDALQAVTGTLNTMQQAVLVKAAKNGALVTYALHKSPQRLAALAAIKDPIKLAVATVDLEKGLKMTTRRRAPDPETTVRGSAPLSRGASSAEKEYERLSATATDRGELKKYREKHGLDIHGKAARG